MTERLPYQFNTSNVFLRLMGLGLAIASALYGFRLVTAGTSTGWVYVIPALIGVFIAIYSSKVEITETEIKLVSFVGLKKEITVPWLEVKEVRESTSGGGRKVPTHQRFSFVLIDGSTPIKDSLETYLYPGVREVIREVCKKRNIAIVNQKQKPAKKS